MKTTNTANLIASLNDITIGHTTTVRDIVVTRWTGGFELNTWGRANKLLTAEEAAAKLAAS
jgi:predicted deacetylase